MKKSFLILCLLALGITFASANGGFQSEFYRLVKKQARHTSGPIDISAFVDALTVPPTLKIGPKTSQITLTLSQFETQFYQTLPKTKIWGYNGSSPGPTIEVESGKKLTVFWKNNLPKVHLLPSDGSLMPGMSVNANLPPVRAVTHLHGAAVMDAGPSNRFHNNDGWPDFWTLPGETQVAEYPNLQTARALWYHDHSMGSTARNVNAGLAGLYLIRDAYERSLQLPQGKYEIPLIFQTRDFNDDGSLAYPSRISAEVYGSAISVNGKVWPYLNVEPRKYRFRMLNASNARSLSMKLLNIEDESAGPAFYQIGSDAGFLEKTVILNDPSSSLAPRLTLNPAERADLIIDFSKNAGKTFLLENNNMGDDADAQLYLPQLMIFKVANQATSPDLSQIPNQMKPIIKTPLTATTPTRKIVLSQVDTPNAPPVLMLNEKVWDDLIEEKVKLGSTEVWELINALPDGHPFHIHLVQFQVLGRRPFDVAHFNQTKEVVYTGNEISPDENERGWKDTVLATPGLVTRVITQFGPYPGKFVYHCHILEHEDMGMMRPFEIVP